MSVGRPGVWSRYVLRQWAGCVEQVRTVSVGWVCGAGTYCVGGPGVWSRYVLCQKLCAAGLVRAQALYSETKTVRQALWNGIGR